MGTDPELSTTLLNWTRILPESSHAHSAMAMQHVSLAWIARSAKNSSKVSEKEWKNFRTRMKHGHRIAATALKLDSNNPVAGMVRFIYHWSNGTDEQKDQILKDTISQFGSVFEVMEYCTKFCHPKWGGNIKHILSIIEASSAHYNSDPRLISLRAAPIIYQADIGMHYSKAPLDCNSLSNKGLNYGDSHGIHSILARCHKKKGSKYEELKHRSLALSSQMSNFRTLYEYLHAMSRAKVTENRLKMTQVGVKLFSFSEKLWSVHLETQKNIGSQQEYEKELSFAVTKFPANSYIKYHHLFHLKKKGKHEECVKEGDSFIRNNENLINRGSNLNTMQKVLMQCKDLETQEQRKMKLE